MSTTLNITADRARDDLRTGDRIIALDGTLLPHARTVANPKHLAGLNKVPAINLVNETGSDVEWNLYLHNFDEVTVERSRGARSEGDVVAEPGEVVVAATEEKNNDKSDESLIERSTATADQTPPKLPRPRTRTVGDVVLVSHGDGYWESQDGDWVISHEQRGTIVCEEPHPVRITAPMVEYARANPRSPFAADVMSAARSGKKGFVCPGGVEHDGDLVWILDSGTYRVNELFDRFGDALAAMEDELRRRV